LRIDADAVAQLVGRLRGISGDEHVLTHQHDLRTDQSDGLLRYLGRTGSSVRTPPGSTSRA
jgi:hypothetical protein